jgi:hypothetical protein
MLLENKVAMIDGGAGPVGGAGGAATPRRRRLRVARRQQRRRPHSPIDRRTPSGRLLPY